VAVSPWVLRVFSFYISASSEGALTGGLDNRNLILANRTVDPILLTLIVVLIPAFFMLKASRKRYVDRANLLLVAWFLVPVVMTQAYIFGIYTDYSRFMYFIDFHGIIIISAGLLYLSRYTSIAITRVPKIRLTRIKKVFPAIAFSVIIFIFITASLWSIFPGEGMKRANFYSTIQQPEATALEWIKNNTQEDSVLVADHLYGWWLSGIAERPTLSAAGLEFLIYSHELEVAKSSQLLLDIDYYIDNGIIQVRDDGPYISRHDPEFSIKKGSGESYTLPNFQDNKTLFDYYWIDNYGQRVDENTTLADLELVETPVISKDENSANLTTTYENELFIVKKTVTVQRGERFAEISYDIEVKDTQTVLYNVWIPVSITEDNVTVDEETLTFFGFYDSAQEMCSQVIFRGDTPAEIKPKKGPSRVEMLFRYPWKRNINIKMLVGVFDTKNMSWPRQIINKYKYYELYEGADSALQTITSNPINTWNYVEMIEEYDVSYVVCRDQDVYMKFSEDQNFRFMFNSGNVTIFQVTK